MLIYYFLKLFKMYARHHIKSIANNNANPEGIQNQQNIIKGRDGVNMLKQVIEDVFLSRQTTFPDNDGNYDPDNNGIPNPHKSYYVDGKYFFNFNEHWATMPGFNKAIGLRRIDAHPNAYNFTLNMIIRKWTMLGFAISPLTDTFVDIRFELNIVIKTTDTIEDALSTIALTGNNAIQDQLRNKVGIATYQPWADWPKIVPTYNAFHNEAYINWLTTPATNHIAYEIEPTVMDPDFFYMFNVPNVDFNTYLGYKRVCTQASPWAFWYFENVWDRRFLYIHASFVQYTNAQLLGEAGEWYPKPSKIYEFNTSSGGQFWVAVSFDGFSIVKLPYEHWKISLAFIANDKNYQSE
jgi:hypothetical protein